jgi:hypothetical protein
VCCGPPRRRVAGSGPWTDCFGTAGQARRATPQALPDPGKHPGDSGVAFIAARISESSTTVGSTLSTRQRGKHVVNELDDRPCRVPATRPPSPFFVVIIKDALLQQEPFARPYQLIFYTLRIDDRVSPFELACLETTLTNNESKSSWLSYRIFQHSHILLHDRPGPDTGRGDSFGECGHGSRAVMFVPPCVAHQR